MGRQSKESSIKCKKKERRKAMEYYFRQATWDDFDFLFELKKQNFKWYVDQIWGWEDEDQKQRVIEDLKQHLKDKKIIMVDNFPIGVYAFHITEQGDFFINEISIIKNYQNRKIGTQILTKQLEENKIQNRRTILQVFKNNKAKKLYEKLGFKIYGETETHYQMEIF